MADQQDNIKVKALFSYISKRKKPWGVAVFDQKTKKRAVGNSLSELLTKFKKHSELVVVNYQEWLNSRLRGKRLKVTRAK